MEKFLLVVSAFLGVTRGAAPAFGPWMGILDNANACTQGEYKDLPTQLLVKFGNIKKGSLERSVLEGEVTVPYGVTNDFEVLLRLQELKHGKWQMVLDNEMGPACKSFDIYLKTMWNLVLDHIEVPESYTDGEARCVKPGNGLISGPFKLPPIEMSTIPSFFYGKYKGSIVFHHPNKTAFACTEFDINIVPKDKQKP